MTPQLGSASPMAGWEADWDDGEPAFGLLVLTLFGGRLRRVHTGMHPLIP